MAKKQGFLNVDFDPDLRVVQQDFVRLGRSFENKREVMLAAEVVAQRDIEEMFEGEHDAMGDPWAPWKDTAPYPGSQSYAERAENYPNIGILRRNDDLHHLATSSHQFVIERNHLTYGHDLPQWAGVHLHGGRKVYNDGYRIPQRSFYPYSIVGVQKVHMLFDDWAEHNISIWEQTSKGGRSTMRVQTRVPTGRGAETRFGPSPLL